jgi:hypothetical protein
MKGFFLLIEVFMFIIDIAHLFFQLLFVSGNKTTAQAVSPLDELVFT